NNDIIINETWTNDIIKIEIDDLEPGDYNFTLDLFENDRDRLSDSVLVRVYPDLTVSNLPNTVRNTDWTDRLFNLDSDFVIGGAAIITGLGAISLYRRRR
ncbi:MAG: hypothetical protein ACW99A_14495, partial [Candidatus Kariarchaeaceae archaeon]